MRSGKNNDELFEFPVDIMSGVTNYFCESRSERQHRLVLQKILIGNFHERMACERDSAFSVIIDLRSAHFVREDKELPILHIQLSRPNVLQ